MNSGEKVELSKQILQLPKTHPIAAYKKCCEEIAFDSLCNRKLFAILTGLKLTQQEIVSGLDDFVAEGIEVWHSLSGTCKLQVESRPEKSLFLIRCR